MSGPLPAAAAASVSSSVSVASGFSERTDLDAKISVCRKKLVEEAARKDRIVARIVDETGGDILALSRAVAASPEYIEGEKRVDELRRTLQQLQAALSKLVATVPSV